MVLINTYTFVLPCMIKIFLNAELHKEILQKCYFPVFCLKGKQQLGKIRPTSFSKAKDEL